MDDDILVLASGSPTRRRLLEQAGLNFVTEAPQIDEQEIKSALQAEEASVDSCVELLAELKALRISTRYPGRLVIGADQILDFDGAWFDKPQDQDQARAQLMQLRGKSHELVTAAVVALNGQRLWHHVDRAFLTMRDFSDDYLDHYLMQSGPEILTSVGAYQFEGRGVQLFQRVTGDFFTILGLPMLPFLNFLRDRKFLKS